MPWSRTSPLSPGARPGSRQTWTNANGHHFEIEVTVGKTLDVLGLKGASLEEARSYERFLRATADRLYAYPLARTDCPCCTTPSDEADEVLKVFGVPYVRCITCGHGFVRDRPGADVLDEVFAESEAHSGTYVDPEGTAVRMAQVVSPKVDWVLRTWAIAVGGAPRSVVDVGAGGGHMLAGFREAGLEVTGHELSAASRQFAREAFGLHLVDHDFRQPGGRVDLVTFWGLLEYVSSPRELVAAARERLGSGGMLVVEVPRFDALGTAVQAAPGAVVSRHLDPTTHVNCFSDESLVTMLAAEGFRPVAAWYFGMDAYELLVQLALRHGGDDALRTHGDLVLSLQPWLDAALLCDDIVIAAVPSS